MSIERRKVLMKNFIESQFAYCPLVWVYCDKTSDNRINHLHERAFRMSYSVNVSTFQKLLEKDNSVTIYVRNLRILKKNFPGLKSPFLCEVYFLTCFIY